MAAKKTPLKPWTSLKPHRDGVELTGTRLLGHLWWWRQGQPAPDLVVPGVKKPEQVDWADFPAEAPEGFEEPPKKKRPSGEPVRQANDERSRKIVSVSLPADAREMLDELAVRHGGNKSAAVESLIREAAAKK